MDEQALEEQLRSEGFRTTYIWQDAAGAYYPEHTHASETAHIILSGQMTLTMDGKSCTFSAGERCDVPAGRVHSAKIGSHGCRYLIGER
ncbi:MAG TPA: cupin domain-containing protein [Candidatus Acidoferrales bacterium]|nr:cupin domain-containing protein [Candidatus Acidoferrales bacterium]